jgi:hypothetical protein
MKATLKMLNTGLKKTTQSEMTKLVFISDSHRNDEDVLVPQ